MKTHLFATVAAIVASASLSPSMSLAVTASPNYAAVSTNLARIYRGDRVPDNCPLQQRQDSERIYRLCIVNNRPAALYVLPIDAPSGYAYYYRGGRLTGYSEAEHFINYGFRNGRIMATWNDDRQTYQFFNSSLPRGIREAQTRLNRESRSILQQFGF
jgi:hypothetical protein